MSTLLDEVFRELSVVEDSGNVMTAAVELTGEGPSMSVVVWSIGRSVDLHSSDGGNAAVSTTSIDCSSKTVSTDPTSMPLSSIPSLSILPIMPLESTVHDC